MKLDSFERLHQRRMVCYFEMWIQASNWQVERWHHTNWNAT